MTGNPPEFPGGFSNHVMDQLQQAAHQVPNPQQGRGRGRGRGGRNQGQGQGQSRARSLPAHGFPIPPPNTPYPPPPPPPPEMDAFPPLGSRQTSAAPNRTIPTQPIQPPRHQPQPRAPTYQRQVDPREFFDRARGDYRPRQSGNRHFQHNYPVRPMQMQAHDDFRRPPVPHGNLYQHNAPPVVNSWAGFSSPGHDLRHQVMAQSDYLNELQMRARSQHQLKLEESQMKESFRRKLETFFQDTLIGKYPDLESSDIRLKCYGSLNNGFGLADCDMDLLLALPKGYTLKGRTASPNNASIASGTQTPVPPEDEAATAELAAERTEETFELGWLLEDALLNAKIGARLLTNTRVPIMKICEKPDDGFLEKMRQYSKESRKPPSPKLPARETSLAKYPPVLDMKAIELALSDLDDSDSAAQISIPQSPQKINAASIEFSGEHGIKCDINFSNFVAIVNTRLLKEYCAYDHRVAEVGVFVKTWAKLRDINTPYWGTLSSYGYVLMVLHYLMNVVNPPVIPNLQYLARDDDAWKDQVNIELFEGKYDVRFWTDRDKIAGLKSTSPKNRESTGHLIRGFFWYYSAREGFNYKFDTISIRSNGGITKKQEKGWTEAKWASDNKNVRQRYLLAIEDPFETEHNVARVVGHNGIVAIRDEFRRAWDIISKIGTPSAMGGSLLEPVENRGDLLRRDQEHHRQKMRQMRLDVEAKERETRKMSLQANGDAQENGMFNENDLSSSLPSSMRSSRRRSSNKLLTRNVGTFQDKPRQTKNGRHRMVKEDSEDSSDAGNKADDERAGLAGTEQTSMSMVPLVIDLHEHPDGVAQDDEEDPEPFCDPAEILMKNGLDAHNNPIPWDISTQDGRWLQWRDNKIRKRTWQGVAHQPGWAVLDKMCPFDPRRPRPDNSREHKDAHELLYVLKPPVPLNNAEGITSTEKALSAAIPKPYLASNQPSKPHATPHTFHERKSSNIDSPVGLPIPWDKTTRGGRWLMKRDAMIRLGTYKPSKPSSMHAKLNRRFPYDATTSRSQVDNYNEELRTHYKRTLGPVKEPKRSDEIGDTQNQDDDDDDDAAANGDDGDADSFVNSLFSEPTESSANPIVSESRFWSHALTDALWQEPPTKPDLTINSSLTAFSDDRGSEPATDDMPDSIFIRSRRLAFYAQQELESSQTRDNDKVQDEENVKGLMKEAGIDPRNPTFAHKDSAVSRIFTLAESSGILRLDEDYRQHWPYGKRPWTKRTRSRQMLQMDGPVSMTESSENQFSEPTEPFVKVADSSEAAEKPAKGQPDEPSRVDEHQVPDTLYPDLDNEKRPRDEDPNIMPIPRNYGFEFDVRQLHDLAVIKEGGNGCAREGFQFEIEQDYELGGSGEMAWRQSSGKHFSSNANNNEVYEYGKGDEEGLLGELPDL